MKLAVVGRRGPGAITSSRALMGLFRGSVSSTVVPVRARRGRDPRRAWFGPRLLGGQLIWQQHSGLYGRGSCGRQDLLAAQGLVDREVRDLVRLEEEPAVHVNGDGPAGYRRVMVAWVLLERKTPSVERLDPLVAGAGGRPARRTSSAVICSAAWRAAAAWAWRFWAPRRRARVCDRATSWVSRARSCRVSSRVTSGARSRAPAVLRRTRLAGVAGGRRRCGCPAARW